VLAQLEAWHPDDLRLVFRHFPLIPIHDKASLAGQAAEAAGAQNAFWGMHDLLFERYSEWVEFSPEEFQSWLIEEAGDVVVDLELFRVALEDGQYAADMSDVFERNVAAGIPQTPFVFLNGEWYRLPLSLINLEASIRLENLALRQFEAYPQMTIDTANTYSAHLELQDGEIVILLYPEYAELAVNNFIFLSGEGWYDNNIFHFVQAGVIVVSGDPSATGLGDPGYHFKDELDSPLNFDEPGMVGLVNRGPDTNGSQFIINLSPLPELNESHTIFGRVIRGLELLQNLPDRQPFEDLLQPAPITILSIRIEEQ
jgi:cyclophilin family peptidyl-prolyl cis-trans isomerase